MFVVSVVAFLVVYMIPGGPATAILGMEATPDQISALNAQLGFDRPFLVQYLDWFGNVLHGNWGNSYFLQTSVLSAIGEYFGPTLSLAILAQIFALILSVPLGILAAVKKGRVTDAVIRFLSFIGNSLPNFVVSLLLLYFFALKLGWFPIYRPVHRSVWCCRRLRLRSR